MEAEPRLIRNGYKPCVFIDPRDASDHDRVRYCTILDRTNSVDDTELALTDTSMKDCIILYISSINSSSVYISPAFPSVPTGLFIPIFTRKA
ncbi:unnamed protein product [Litomosoides sigmodontis]|uniref:Uncharacterized protein n=1 Tax=Litomosoides sigmodontis TaxID=42156 RepID=A0A3P6U438_LITSI|nr:unnamed protein product [Litomosoides sigmodontis]